MTNASPSTIDLAPRQCKLSCKAEWTQDCSPFYLLDSCSEMRLVNLVMVCVTSPHDSKNLSMHFDRHA